MDNSNLDFGWSHEWDTNFCSLINMGRNRRTICDWVSCLLLRLADDARGHQKKPLEVSLHASSPTSNILNRPIHSQRTIFVTHKIKESVEFVPSIFTSSERKLTLLLNTLVNRQQLFLLSQTHIFQMILNRACHTSYKPSSDLLKLPVFQQGNSRNTRSDNALFYKAEESHPL